VSRILILILIIGLLAACGQSGIAPLPTATVSSPTQPVPTVSVPTQPAPTGTPIRVDLSPAQRAAMQALVAAINVPIEQVQLVSTEAVQWPDGCLGIVRMGVMCMRGPIDGFRIILAANGQQYEFHTNQDGTSIGQLAKAPFVGVAVRLPDNSIQIVDTHVPVDPRPVQITTGLLPQAGVTKDTIYALDFSNQPQVVVADKAGTRPLDFIRTPNYGLAVWPGDQPRLGWATSPTGESTPSQLFVSPVDGSVVTTLLTDTTPITAPHQWVAQRWSLDGQSLYFSTEPYGIGGYILLAGASSLSRVNVNDRSVQDVIPYNMNGGLMLCLDELSSDERLVADHCDNATITIRDLSNDQATTVRPPADITGFAAIGSTRFNPDLTRVAFALAKRDPSDELGWVAVSDSLSGDSKLIVTGQPGEYFSVVSWLNAETLLLQSNQIACNATCTNSLWTVKIDGSGLTKVTDGQFLALVE